METKNINEVVNNFKKELGKLFSQNGFEIEYPKDNFNGIVIKKNHFIFFIEFFDHGGGDAVRSLDDNSRKPIIRLEISQVVGLPQLNVNQRIILMERIADETGIVLKKMDSKLYILKTSSLFIDELQMFAIATTSIAYFNDANHIIYDFLKTAGILK